MRRAAAAIGGAAAGVAAAAWAGAHPLGLLLVAAVIAGLAQQALP